MNQLVKSNTIDSWEALLKSYPSQTKKVQLEIMGRLSLLSTRHGEMIRNTPQYKLHKLECTQISAKIELVLADVDKVKTSADIDKMKFRLNELISKTRMPNSELLKNQIKSVVRKMRDIYLDGLSSSDERLRSQSEKSFGETVDKLFSPVLVPLYWKCGTRSDESELFDPLREAATEMLHSQIKRDSGQMLGIVRKRFVGFEDVLIALCENRIAGVKGEISKLLASPDTTQRELGIRCLISWPIPEMLPKLIRELRNSDEDSKVDEAILSTAFLCYGQAAPNEILRQWTTFPPTNFAAIVDIVAEIPCRSSVDVIFQAISDPDPQNHFDAAYAMARLLGSEWNVEYSGKDPRNLNRNRIRQILFGLSKDEDNSVREVVLRALNAENEKTPSPILSLAS